ncbi:putative delta-60 repeat protein [Tahibacter aquaticus]|uniref:Putative delta-60 repeat protein n=1 Tax=Tahibacter aquaticus TaxID=520092 RepID=A0A4R6Z949_9GAMM|nr:delta-60 repeat domain-containing protein [Tahibacter aquaticus]TDR48411.1 putative delta-60 repeat protein [Tahibacter aquaticus]
MRLTLVLAALLLGTAAQAAEQLDPFRITGTGLNSFKAIALLPQPNGNLVEIFEFPTQSGSCGDPACIGIRRWTTNATQIDSLRVKAAALQSVKAATVDSRGRIIVIGPTQGAGADGSDFGVVRFKADGSDDTSFAGDGGTAINFGLGQGNNDYPLAVTVDRDDNVIVAGSAQRSAAGDTDFAVVRLRAADGGLDTTFSGDGKTTVFFDLGPNTRIDQANAVAVRNDGKIVLGGIALDSTISRLRPVLAQLNVDGSLDATFCASSCSFNAGYNSINNGRRVYYFGQQTAHADEILGIDVAANNDIAIAGNTYSDDGATRQAAIARFDGSGVQQSERLEPGLNGNGRYTDVRFADGAGTRVIAVGDSGPGPNYFIAQAFTGSMGFDSTYGNCLSSNSGLCFIGGSGLGDDGPNNAGQLFLDARGRPLFAGSFVISSDPGRSHTLIQRITNNSGPLPDRIFRNGLQ